MKTVVLAATLLSGCAITPGHTVYEAAVGANVSKAMPWSRNQQGGFDGGEDTVRFTVRHELGNGRTFISYSHVSHLSSGWPANDRVEDWLDMVEFGVRFDFQE